MELVSRFRPATVIFGFVSHRESRSSSSDRPVFPAPIGWVFFLRGTSPCGIEYDSN